MSGTKKTSALFAVDALGSVVLVLASFAGVVYALFGSVGSMVA